MDEEPGTTKPTIRLEHLVHKGERCIALAFPYNSDLIAAAKKTGARWSGTQKRWYVPNAPENLRIIFQALKGVAWVDSTALFAKPIPASGPMPTTARQQTQARRTAPTPPPAIGAAQQAALNAMQRKLEIARYSPNSITTYLNATKQFFIHFPQKHPNDIRTEDIEAYQHHLARSGTSNSYLNQVVNAVRYYYMNVVGDAQRVTFIERPRKERKLPTVLSEKEVTALLRSVDNLKHRCILMLIYSAGLRLGELIALRLSDVAAERHQLLVRGGKGNKDRITLLSAKVMPPLQAYLTAYAPSVHLFEGVDGGPCSPRSVQRSFHRAKEKAGITKPATVHTLRHSLATHLWEKGTVRCHREKGNAQSPRTQIRQNTPSLPRPSLD